MEIRNMTRATIRALASEGKPLYLETGERAEDGSDTLKRFRIFRVRVHKGRFEARLMHKGQAKWYPVSEKQVVCAY